MPPPNESIAGAQGAGHHQERAEDYADDHIVLQEPE
jgi:hypothetical protein